jgi:hypothetical protein
LRTAQRRLAKHGSRDTPNEEMNQTREDVNEQGSGQRSEYLTPAEVAKLLRVSLNMVLRQFGDLPGVMVIGTPGKFSKRRVRVLRIPLSALNLFLAKHSAT